MDTDETLIKVYVETPNHWQWGGESLWAKQTGPEAYEIRSVPFAAYGLNWGDVVEAVSEKPDLKPQVLRVLRRSGHRTVRVVFLDKSMNMEERMALLRTLTSKACYFEHASGSYFALDAEDPRFYYQILDQLRKWSKEEILSFETCEERVEGSFGDVEHGL